MKPRRTAKLRRIKFNVKVASAITGPRFFGSPAVLSVLAGSNDKEEAKAHSIDLHVNGSDSSSSSSSHNRGWQPCGRATLRLPAAMATCLNVNALNNDACSHEAARSVTNYPEGCIINAGGEPKHLCAELHAESGMYQDNDRSTDEHVLIAATSVDNGDGLIEAAYSYADSFIRPDSISTDDGFIEAASIYQHGFVKTSSFHNDGGFAEAASLYENSSTKPEVCAGPPHRPLSTPQ